MKDQTILALEALGRLCTMAQRDTGQSRRVAVFLLAWHHAEENGKWDPTDLWTVDEAIADDMLTVVRLIREEHGKTPTISGSNRRFNTSGSCGVRHALEESMAAAAGIDHALSGRKRAHGTAYSRQRFLHCLVCRSAELCSAGLCRSCYDAVYHSEAYFGGLKEVVLDRDGRCCRTCGDPTDLVHHRKPAVNELAWLITVCARCHAVVHRLQRLDRYLPPLLLDLWREQHPKAAAAEQLALAWEAAASASSRLSGKERSCLDLTGKTKEA